MIIWRGAVRAWDEWTVTRTVWRLLWATAPRTRRDWWRCLRLEVGISFWDAWHKIAYLTIGPWTFRVTLLCGQHTYARHPAPQLRLT